MKESKGKATAREIFYAEYIPQALTLQQRQAGNVLILLGDQPRELPYLDGLGIKRNRIMSVERSSSVFDKQALDNLKRPTNEKISLHRGEMVSYLKDRLLHDENCVILNLDIEGSYVNQLDPAMTDVLLFGWRFPQTVIATYHSCLRDRGMLWEGVKSLVIFCFVNAELTKKTVTKLWEFTGSAALPNSRLCTMLCATCSGCVASLSIALSAAV